MGTPSHPAHEPPLPPQSPHASTNADAFSERYELALTLRSAGCWASKYTSTLKMVPVLNRAKFDQSSLSIGDGMVSSPLVAEDSSGKKYWSG